MTFHFTKKRLTSFLSLLFICLMNISIVHGAGSFCYRDDTQRLICKESIDQIPESFKQNSFFVSDSSTNKPSNKSGGNNTRSRFHRDQPLDRNLGQNNSTNKVEVLESQSAPKHPDHFKATLPPITENVTSPKKNSIPQSKKETNTLSVSEGIPNTKQAGGLPPAKGYKSSDSKNTKNENSEVNSISKKTEYNKDAIVTIYVADWCSHCKELEKFLKSENIAYNKFDVEKDPEAISLYETHGSVPISKIGSNLVVGFEPERYKSLVEASIPY